MFDWNAPYLTHHTSGLNVAVMSDTLSPGTFVSVVAPSTSTTQQWQWDNYDTLNSVADPAYSLTDSVTPGQEKLGKPVHMWPLEASLARNGRPNAQWALYCVPLQLYSGGTVIKGATTSTA